MRQSETSGVLPIDAARTDRPDDRGAADAQPTLPTDASAAQSSQVLIVEDESIVALNLKHMLQRLGYSVVGMAHASAEALDLAATGRPDVVLMDINLGAGRDGIETAAMIAAHGDPAVIYLTAYSEPTTLARAQKTRPYGYLLKPFSEQELHATLQMTLERHRLDRLLAQSERRLTLALDAARMGTWDLSAGGETVQCSAATGAMIGPAGAPLVDSWARFLERVVPEDRSAVDAASTDTVVNGVPLHVEFRGRPLDGESRWIRLQGRRYDADSGSEVIGVAQDVTDSRNGELALRRAAAVFDAITEPIFIADALLRLTTVNAAFVAVTGQPAADVVGRVLDGWLLRSAVGQRLPDLAAELATHGHWRGEVVALRRAGEAFSAWLNATAITDAAGAMTQVVVILSDIGTLRRAEADLIHAAHHDTLTGLPNRILAMDRLEQAIGRAKRKDWRCVVMMVDLDHLKHVNDGFGHAAGDEFLCAAASRMRETLRSEDTVARLGGDEFIVVLDNIERTSDVAILAGKMLTRLADPLMVGGTELRSSASMGISVFPDDAQDPAALVLAADTAMFVAKQEGRGRFAFFKPQMGHRLSRRAAAIGDLRRGLAAGELEVHYQPQVSLTDMRLTALEALVRWQHPKRGLLGAAEIVPLAEENGLIVEVGAFVIGSACRQIRQWLDAGLSCPRVAVNVSVKQLRSRAFAPAVEAILGEHAVPAALIELELTESTLQQENVCMPAMQALASLGMALAIDDFGTGYSSLNSLRHLPVGRVKIDRCFINEIASHTSDAAITEAIIELGHRLGMRITAEGVETTAQLEVLRHLGCDEVQGYLIARPMPVEALHALLRESDSARCTSPAYWQAFERSVIDAKPVPSSR